MDARPVDREVVKFMYKQTGKVLTEGFVTTAWVACGESVLPCGGLSISSNVS